MRSPSELTEVFRANGRKVTPQRQAIFRALEGNDDHPSAEAVYDLVRREMETISLKTVYQTLNDLAELGEIAALDLGTGAARFDPDVERPHHHLVCRSCGKVRDVFVALRGLELPEAYAQGYDVGSAEVVFRGTCAECRPSSAPAARQRGRSGTGPQRSIGAAARIVSSRVMSSSRAAHHPPPTREEQCPR